MTPHEQAADLLTISPRYRMEAVAEALADAFKDGAESARNWHKSQARIMRDIVNDGERRRIDSETAHKAAQWAAHHEYCATNLPWRIK